ncbi:MAG: hypothetical protein LBH59_07945 [Planctomycetaceae bacterium]|jgi:DNA-directed RNA polymerase specialized sigma24 family protein|nr:hypothetical protein [Planctomycetaceae bacterium]
MQSTKSEHLGKVSDRLDLSFRVVFETQQTQKSASFGQENFFNNLNIQRNIASLIRVYSAEVCEKEIDESHAHFETYLQFLIVCIRFHAGQSQFELQIDELIQALQNGRSPSMNTCLGGDPLRDCVLAVSLLSKDRKAVVVFEKDYFNYLKSIARRIHATFGNDADDWWNEFLDFLAGYSRTNGKLEKYQGKSALRPWLRVVLWNFLRRRPIADNTTEIIEDALATKPNTNEIELNENITFFANLVRESVQEIPKRDRLLLAMIYIDNLLKKDIAAMFQVHPGQIGRWERAAVDLFRQNLLHRLENLPNRDSYETLVGGIANNPKEFSEALIETLKLLRNENTDQ